MLGIRRKQFETIWSTFTIWLSLRSRSGDRTRISLPTLFTTLCLHEPAWWAEREFLYCGLIYSLTFGSVYKGSKIEWDVDECSSPIEKPLQPRRENLPPKKKDAPPMNRFHLLNLDGTDDDSQGETDELDISGVPIPAHFASGLVVWVFTVPSDNLWLLNSC